MFWLIWFRGVKAGRVNSCCLTVQSRRYTPCNLTIPLKIDIAQKQRFCADALTSGIQNIRVCERSKWFFEKLAQCDWCHNGSGRADGDRVRLFDNRLKYRTSPRR